MNSGTLDGQVVVVTGGGSGMGASFARRLASDGARLVINDVNEVAAGQVASEVGGEAAIFDVTDSAAFNAAIDRIAEHYGRLDVLINNAGNAHGLDPIQTGSVADWDAMIDINVKGLLYVSKAIIPGMTQRNSGHIINIGSIAGKEVYPNGNVYCASKHAVDALTNGMRMDLNSFGIKVMGIHPGLVETEFSLVRFKGDTQRAGTVYKGYSPLLAQDIADIVEFALNRPPHVVLADVVVLPTAQASATVIHKKLS